MKKYLCEHCKSDLTHSDGIAKYRLELSAKYCPHTDAPIYGLYMCPPINEDKHFCGLGCLREWLK